MFIEADEHGKIGTLAFSRRGVLCYRLQQGFKLGAAILWVCDPAKYLYDAIFVWTQHPRTRFLFPAANAQQVPRRSQVQYLVYLLICIQEEPQRS